MITHSDFWLLLHDLTAALDANGQTSAERMENVVEEFHRLSPLAREVVQRELEYLLAELVQLEPLIVPAATGEAP